LKREPLSRPHEAISVKRSLLCLAAALLVFLILRAAGSSAFAALPKTLEAAPCHTAPTIDGVIDAGEWRDAPAHIFDISMIRIDPAATEKRPCELRVMNSAGALYVALKVPDTTIDNSLAPLMLDAAILAFCQGVQVRARDDRKVIAQGIYRDKFVEAPGKGDGDDPHQDGLGAITRDKGICTFEWAVPLDSGDKDDLKAKPGDSFRFNLAYFDGLQLPLTKTRMGGAYGLHLDTADEWGTIRLAANVKDDGGTAFQGPSWAKALVDQLKKVSPARLRVTSNAAVPGSNPPAAKVLVSFTYRDSQGKEKEAKAKFYLPGSIHNGRDARHPLYFNAGYELPDGAEQDYLRRGWLVVSPRELETNPLIRTTNPDVALLHLARALPWVDDARVMIGGGSAGGWMTLMLAAETFPLAGAAPDVPPVNWGYNGAYFYKQLEKIGPEGASAAKVPALFGVGSMLKSSLTVYGADHDDPTWFAASPVAHALTITGPVSVYFSTADVLVPVNQVGARFVQPFDVAQFPAGFTMDAEKLMVSRQGRLRLLDVLPDEAYEIFNLTIPKGTSRHNVPGGPGHATTCELPVSADKLWSIGIIDEGPPEPGIDHRKYDLMPVRNTFWERVVTGQIAPAQLTATKLEQLMDRYAGKEWPPSRLQHLDFQQSERRDVVRGLSTYISASAANRARFTGLYSRLPAGKRVLEPEVLEGVQASHASR
jgi:hypothetical protein